MFSSKEAVLKFDWLQCMYRQYVCVYLYIHKISLCMIFEVILGTNRQLRKLQILFSYILFFI